MHVILKGTVLEILPEHDEKRNLLPTVTLRVFQKGVRNNIDVKNVPTDRFDEGEIFESMVRVSAYHFSGMTGLSCKYIME